MADRDQVTIEGGGGHRSAGRPAVRWGEQEVAIRDTTLLGSSESVGVRVTDPLVSRLHLELSPRPEGLFVRDLGSRNGTFVGNLRIERAVLPEGTTFRVGDTDVHVTSARAAPREEKRGASSFHGLVGQSAASRTLFSLLERVAASDAPALVSGETGTGKEVVARALHDASPRRDHPFVIVDCAALPEALLEGELFGHAKGAFTGAIAARAGAFESAAGGTVFLDEIGELPLAMQPKLLRVLESKTVRRLGETAQRPVDIRFVAATHRDLPGMVTRGTFREDLFFRLSVLPVRIAPLRERPEDLPVLLAQFEKALGLKLPLDLTQRAKLTSFHWPGNVRELRNFVDRVAALGADAAFEALGVLTEARPPSPPPAAPDSLPSAGTELPATRGSYRAFRDAWSRAGDRVYVRDLLERHRGEVVDAAVEAQIDKSYFYRLVRREK